MTQAHDPIAQARAGGHVSTWQITEALIRSGDIRRPNNEEEKFLFMTQVVRPAGTWEQDQQKITRPATWFDPIS